MTIIFLLAYQKMSTRGSRLQLREQAVERQAIENRKKEIEKYRNTIYDRLETFRSSKLTRKFLDKYKAKLQEHKLNPNADISKIHDVNNLSQRMRLLPPLPVYQHHTNPRHPSAKEPRAVAARSFKGHTREYMKKQCPNDQTLLSPYDFSSYVPIKRYAPKNILQFRTADGKSHCVADRLLRFYNKNGYTAAPSYQNDSFGDHWPEITNVGNKEPFIRVPFHVLNDAAGNKFRVPDSSNRRLPPSANEYD